MCSNEGKLFAKTVPVSITDGFCKSFRFLFLSVEWQQTSAVVMKKELLMTLTDDNDPFFLYNLQLSEDDFKRLKSSQNLLMDFSHFPETVTHFLELCLEEAGKPQPNYLLHLKKEEAVGCIASSVAQLDIEQSSVLRQVSLLSLKFLSAPESTVKQHLTSGFRNLKEENQGLQNRLCQLEKDHTERFSCLELELKKKTQELEILNRDLKDEMSRRESNHAEKMREEREKLTNRQREVEDRMENDRIGRESKLKDDVLQLEARVKCLETLNKDLENNKIRLEKDLDEQRSHIVSVENELSQKIHASKITEKKKSDLATELKNCNMYKNQLLGNINQLNEDLRSKHTEIHSLQKDLDSCKKEKKRLRSSLDAVEEQLQMEKNLKEVLEKDKMKANQIISKMHASVNEESEMCKMLKERNSELQNSLTRQNQLYQKITSELDKERDINRKLINEVHLISMYQDKITKLEAENKSLLMANGALSRMVYDKGLIPSYVPPPEFSKSLLASEVIDIQASGDNNLGTKENFAKPTSATQTKSVPRRYENSFVDNDLLVETRPLRTSMIGDSTNSTSQDAKASTILASDKNVNQSNLIINSNGLSSEFKSLNVSKHSTARKQTKIPKSRLPVKS